MDRDSRGRNRRPVRTSYRALNRAERNPINAEAPYSLNTHYTLRGWPFQLTIRGDDYDKFSLAVEEAITQLEKAGAVPADMIWAAKAKPQVQATAPIPAPLFQEVPATTPRPVGRPPKRPDVYQDADGVELCNHLINGQPCTTAGEWKAFPDKFHPGQTKLLWSCTQFFEHDDYKAKEALKAATGAI